jgi:hypothetical protein
VPTITPLLLAAVALVPPTTAESPLRAEFLEVARRLREGHNEFFGHAQVTDLEAKLARAADDRAERVRLHGLLAMEHLRLGQIDRATDAIEAAFRGVHADPALAPLLTGLHRIRGLTNLRQAEVENCIARHNAECCIFPLRGGGVHSRPEPARRAMQSFRFLADHRPDDLKARWLLNLVCMALGEYPDGVPEPLRIPPAAFQSDLDLGRFIDVAPRLGVDALNLCGGCIADDFDRDGWVDVFTTTSDPQEHAILYRNLGDGRFEDRSAAAGLEEQLGGLNCVAADYDNDGDLDVLILRGAWLHEEGRIRNSLLRNDGTRFTDVTHGAGLAAPPAPTQAAAWGDFDNDGHLDLYVGNESRRDRGDPACDFPGQLFHNRGDGTFAEVAAAAGVTNDRYCKGVAAGDIDNDGDLDLYLSNIGPNRLYRNDGRGAFVDVSVAAGVIEPVGRSFACWFFDWNNDGWLDLFVAAYDASVHDVAADAMGLPHRATSPRLYRNNQDGTFSDVAHQVGLHHAWLPMGANFGDIDHDGWLDVYLATGDPDFQTLMPNIMLRNDRGRRFQDVTTSSGLGHLQKGHGVAFADFDHDGDQDIYNQLGGFYPGDRFSNALFANPGGGGRFLIVLLEGTRCNRSAIGTRLRVRVETPFGPRDIHRAVGAVSSFGGSPLRQEIGLGDATGVDELEVAWPGGARQVFRGLACDGAILVREGEPEPRRLPYHGVTFGGI